MVDSAWGVVSGDGEDGEAGIRGYECPLCAKNGHFSPISKSIDKWARSICPCHNDSARSDQSFLS